MEPLLENVIRAAKPHLPLVIGEASFENGVNLVLSGSNWSLAINCPWRITRGGVLLLGSEKEDASVGGLVSQRILAVEPQGRSRIDPVFTLDGDKKLEVFSCHPLEPWVFRLPDGPVWVASPTG